MMVDFKFDALYWVEQYVPTLLRSADINTITNLVPYKTRTAEK